MTDQFADLAKNVNALWEKRDSLTVNSDDSTKDIIEQVISLLDAGTLRVAENVGGEWKVNEWAKKAILMYFRIHSNIVFETGDHCSYDKVPLKFSGWEHEDFQAAGIRVVPGAVVRRSAFLEKGVILMPSFVNLGARVGEGTMIDTWATVGSCAQIGKNCHISGGAGIGGVLEPLQASPVIIEDDCFIGARSEVAEGVRVGKGSVLAMGVFLGQSTRIIDRATGEVMYGVVPPYSVVVPGSAPTKNNPDGPALACAVIVKKVDAKTRAGTSINDLLRD